MTVITSGTWPVDPTTTSGTELATYLNELVNAIQTEQASPSRPPALQKGGVWSKTIGAADIALMFFDGTTDYEIGSVISGNTSFGGVTTSTTAPTPATLGQTWVDTASAGAPILKVYNGTVWEEIGGSTSSPTFAGLTTTDNVSFGDNDKAIFGAGSDLQIYHDGLHSYIDDVGTGDLHLRASNDLILTNADGSATYARFKEGGYARLFYNGGGKLETTSTGVDVTGTLTATTLAGDGSGITGVLKNVTKTVLTTGTAATYTTPTDAFAIEVEVLGAGGGGGGIDGQGSGTAACGIAGGAGGYSQKTIMNPASAYTYTIGAGGAGGASGANAGSAGGTTSFTDGASVTLSSSGGEGGIGRNASGGGSPNGGVLGGVASGGDLNIQGQCSTAGVTLTGARSALSTGGSTKYGAGALASSGAANSPAGFGSGGGAGAVQASTTNRAGTAGTDGIIVITEYRE